MRIHPILAAIPCFALAGCGDFLRLFSGHGGGHSSSSSWSGSGHSIRSASDSHASPRPAAPPPAPRPVAVASGPMVCHETTVICAPSSSATTVVAATTRDETAEEDGVRINVYAQGAWTPLYQEGFASISGGLVGVAVTDDHHWEVGLGLRVGSVALEGGGVPASYIEDMRIAACELTAVWSLLDRQREFTPYLRLTLGSAYLSWDYLHLDGVAAEDGISGCSAGLGAGLRWRPSDGFQIEVECMPTAWGFEPVTDQGLEDDLIGGFSGMTCALGVAWTF